MAPLATSVELPFSLRHRFLGSSPRTSNPIPVIKCCTFPPPPSLPVGWGDVALPVVVQFQVAVSKWTGLPALGGSVEGMASLNDAMGVSFWTCTFQNFEKRGEERRGALGFSLGFGAAAVEELFYLEFLCVAAGGALSLSFWRESTGPSSLHISIELRHISLLFYLLCSPVTFSSGQSVPRASIGLLFLSCPHRFIMPCYRSPVLCSLRPTSWCPALGLLRSLCLPLGAHLPSQAAAWPGRAARAFPTCRCLRRRLSAFIFLPGYNDNDIHVKFLIIRGCCTGLLPPRVGGNAVGFSGVNTWGTYYPRKDEVWGTFSP
eukprot:Gb_38431 [translate_table: standard]